MGRKCAALGCKGAYKSSTEKVTVFAFPLDLELRKVWEHNCKRVFPENYLFKYSGVCEKHFLPEDIIRVHTQIGKDGIEETCMKRFPSLRFGAWPQRHPQLADVPGMPKRLIEEELRKERYQRKRSLPEKKAEFEKRLVIEEEQAKQEKIEHEMQVCIEEAIRHKEEEEMKKNEEKRRKEEDETKKKEEAAKRKSNLHEKLINKVLAHREKIAEMERLKGIEMIDRNKSTEIVELSTEINEEKEEDNDNDNDAILSFELLRTQLDTRLGDLVKSSPWIITQSTEMCIQFVIHTTCEIQNYPVMETTHTHMVASTPNNLIPFIAQLVSITPDLVLTACEQEPSVWYNSDELIPPKGRFSVPSLPNSYSVNVVGGMKVSLSTWTQLHKLLVDYADKSKRQRQPLLMTKIEQIYNETNPL